MHSTFRNFDFDVDVRVIFQKHVQQYYIVDGAGGVVVIYPVSSDRLNFVLLV